MYVNEISGSVVGLSGRVVSCFPSGFDAGGIVVLANNDEEGEESEEEGEGEGEGGEEEEEAEVMGKGGRNT